MTTDSRTAPRSGASAPKGEVSPRLPGAWALAFVAAALLTLLAALVLGGGKPEAPPPGLPDPGQLTGWGLPLARLLLDIAAVGTLGALLVGVVLAPAKKPSGTDAERDSGEAPLSATGLRCVRAAALWATVWAASAAAMLVLTASDVLGAPVSEAISGGQLQSFVQNVQEGRAFLIVVILTLMLAAASYFTLTVNGAVLLLLVAVAALVPPLLTGHSSSAADHDMATSSLVVHVLAATLWVGGLLGLVVHARRSRAVLAVAVPRFSQLALGCYVAVGLSGVINAWVRLGDLDQLWNSNYGALVLAKIAALVVLGWFGHRHREHLVPALAGQRSQAAFLRFAAVEATVMLATVGLAVALSRTPTPVPDDRPLVASAPMAYLGYEVPEMTARTLLTAWRPDTVVLTVAALAAVLYLLGVRRLRASGVAWPVGRTIAWLAGILSAVIVLCSGLATYTSALFSSHMVMHMVLTMVTPILLALGGPVTLALRSLPVAPRGEGRGAREWILAVLHSDPVRVLTNPLVALALYVGSLYVFYYTSLFETALRSHTAHLFMAAHFVTVGCLYFWPIIGIDPLPRRLPHIGRMALMFASMPFHAFFGMAVMSSNELLAGDWFRQITLPWVDRLADQELGGGIAMAFGEIPAVLVLLALFVQWYRADEREARRTDRRADADGDAALAAYNSRLAKLNQRDG
jgi:cytochrome c oxidase assembly factor CtaG/putative copper export protein